MLLMLKNYFTFVKSLKKRTFSPYLLYNSFMKDRIKQIMEAQHMTQQTFANFIGMSPASLSSIFNDRTKPTINTVEAIKSKMPAISTDWLMFGRGTMFVDDAEGNDALQKENGGGYGGEQALDFADVPVAAPVYGQDSRGLHPRRTPDTAMNLSLGQAERPMRRITEIRVFFDDQTYESFVPKK